MNESPDPVAVQEKWDQRYATADQIWSGHPNGTLVREVSGLAPGRVLDVGCGEGADALWLAERGWEVTALDVSRVALDRATAEADRRAVMVNWLHAGLVEAALPSASFELVSAQYPALLRTEDNVSERALFDAVAPGGTLLFVHHPAINPEHAHEHGFHPDDFVSPAGIRALLDGRWKIEVDEVRPRHVETGAGAGHTEDVIVRARRLPTGG
jgi:SAM-dependent methyltransferase